MPPTILDYHQFELIEEFYQPSMDGKPKPLGSSGNYYEAYAKYTCDAPRIFNCKEGGFKDSVLQHCYMALNEKESTKASSVQLFVSGLIDPQRNKIDSGSLAPALQIVVEACIGFNVTTYLSLVHPTKRTELIHPEIFSALEKGSLVLEPGCALLPPGMPLPEVCYRIIPKEVETTGRTMSDAVMQSCWEMVNICKYVMSGVTAYTNFRTLPINPATGKSPSLSDIGCISSNIPAQMKSIPLVNAEQGIHLPKIYLPYIGQDAGVKLVEDAPCNFRMKGLIESTKQFQHRPALDDRFNTIVKCIKDGSTMEYEKEQCKLAKDEIFYLFGLLGCKYEALAAANSKPSEFKAVGRVALINQSYMNMVSGNPSPDKDIGIGAYLHAALIATSIGFGDQDLLQELKFDSKYKIGVVETAWHGGSGGFSGYNIDLHWGGEAGFTRTTTQPDRVSMPGKPCYNIFGDGVQMLTDAITAEDGTDVDDFLKKNALPIAAQLLDFVVDRIAERAKSLF